MRTKKNKPIKLLLATGFALLCIAYGLHIINDDTMWAKIIGWANIIFWSGLLVAAASKITLTKFKQSRKTNS